MNAWILRIFSLRICFQLEVYFCCEPFNNLKSTLSHQERHFLRFRFKRMHPNHKRRCSLLSLKELARISSSIIQLVKLDISAIQMDFSFVIEENFAPFFCPKHVFLSKECVLFHGAILTQTFCGIYEMCLYVCYGEHQILNRKYLNPRKFKNKISFGLKLLVKLGCVPIERTLQRALPLGSISIMQIIEHNK